MADFAIPANCPVVRVNADQTPQVAVTIQLGDNAAHCFSLKILFALIRSKFILLKYLRQKLIIGNLTKETLNSSTINQIGKVFVNLVIQERQWNLTADFPILQYLF